MKCRNFFLVNIYDIIYSKYNLKIIYLFINFKKLILLITAKKIKFKSIIL